MNYIIASFNSRNETISYARVISSSGISASVINTPSALGIRGCTISVKLPPSVLAFAQRILQEKRYSSFNGFYLISYQNGRYSAQRL